MRCRASTTSFLLQLRPDAAAVIYIRLASLNSSLNLHGCALSPGPVQRSTRTLKNLVAGLWFGGMAVLLVIQLVFYYFERKPFYPLLALSTGGAMLVYWANLGYSRLLSFFPMAGYGNDYFTGVSRLVRPVRQRTARPRAFWSCLERLTPG